MKPAILKPTNRHQLEALKGWHSEQSLEDIVSRHGADGYGIGLKEVAGRPTDQLAIRFYVARKRALQELQGVEPFPSTVRYRMGNGREVALPTDVVEAPPVEFQQDPRQVLRPAPGGANVEVANRSGTLGGAVIDRTDQAFVMLSNEHVFGSTPGDPIIQPTLLRGGHRIGTVKRSVKLAASGGRVDAAIGSYDSVHTDFTTAVIEIVGSVDFVTEATLQMPVQKFGQTTRRTHGIVTDINTARPTAEGPIVDCLTIMHPAQPWSGEGDSGAFVMTDDAAPRLVGLHFAGGNGWGYACKIQNVFRELNLMTVCHQGATAFFGGIVESRRQGSDAPLRQSLQHHADALAATTARLDRREASGRGVPPLRRFVTRHRANMVGLLLEDEEMRQFTLQALQPITAAAESAEEILNRPLSREDTARFKQLADKVRDARGLAAALPFRALAALVHGREGRTLARVLGLSEEMKFHGPAGRA